MSDIIAYLTSSCIHMAELNLMPLKCSTLQDNSDCDEVETDVFNGDDWKG